MNAEIESIKEFRVRLLEQHARELGTMDAFLGMLEGGRGAVVESSKFQGASALPPSSTEAAFRRGLPEDLPGVQRKGARKEAPHPSPLPRAERGKSGRKGEERNCEVCGDEFVMVRKDQRFCCKKCSQAFHNGSARKAVELKDMPRRVVSRPGVVKLGGTRAEFDEALRRTIDGFGPEAMTVVEVVQACSTQFPALQSKCTVENVRYKLRRWVEEGELAIAGGGSSPKDPTQFKRGKKWVGPGTITIVEEKNAAVVSRIARESKKADSRSSSLQGKKPGGGTGPTSDVAREYAVFRSGVSVPRDADVEMGDPGHTNYETGISRIKHELKKGKNESRACAGGVGPDRGEQNEPAEVVSGGGVEGVGGEYPGGGDFAAVVGARVR